MLNVQLADYLAIADLDTYPREMKYMPMQRLVL